MLLASTVRYIVLAAAACFVLVLGPIKGAGLIVALLLFVLFINRPYILLSVFFGYSAVSAFLAPFLPKIAASYLDEVFALLIIAVWLVEKLLSRRIRADAKTFLVWVLMLLGITGLSFVANQSAPIALVHFCLTYFQFIPVLLFTLDVWKPSHIVPVRRALVLFMIVQFVLSVSWLAGVNPIPNPRQLWVDRAVGTLGNCSYLGYICVACISFLLHTGQDGKGKSWRIARLSGLMLLGILFLLTFTTHAFPLLFLCLAWWFWVRFLRDGRHSLGLAVSAVMLIAIGVIALNLGVHIRHRNSYYRLPKALSLNRTFESARYSPKGIAYRGVLKEIPERLPYPILGAGPGMASSLVAANRDTPLARRYINFVYSTVSGQIMMMTGSIVLSPHVGFLALYGDIGPLGAGIFYLLHMLALARIWRQALSEQYYLPWQRSLAYALVPIIVSWLALSFLVDLFHVDILQCGLWATIALVWNPHERPAQAGTPDDTPV